MLNYNIDTFDSATKLVRMCEKYKGQMEIDVNWGRYTVDGFSMLGVHSLVGHVVTLDPQTDDLELRNRFERDLEEIK